jgi:hypothetical protein
MKLIDYLHYYLGCDVITTDDNETAELVGVTDNDAHLVHKGTGSYGTCASEGVKPVLRRLEDMAEDEGVKLFGTERYWDIVCKEGRWDSFSCSEFHYLLRQRIDLFNLIDNGLAIDAKTITQ